MPEITEQGIRAGALAFNAEYPEAEAEILSGTPELRVIYSSEGNGWRLRVTATPGVVGADGSFIAAEEPAILASSIRTFDGRDHKKTVRWLVKKNYGTPDVPVNIVRR